MGRYFCVYAANMKNIGVACFDKKEDTIYFTNCFDIADVQSSIELFLFQFVVSKKSTSS